MRPFRFIRTVLRAQRIVAISEESFKRAIRSCANISECNNELCYLVHKRGVFGSQAIEQVERPEAVTLWEGADFVVIKDGEIFELTKR